MRLSPLLAAFAVACTSAAPASQHPADAGSDAGSTGAAADGGSTTAGGNALIAARPYTLHVPTGYDQHRPAPLVILLHGYGANAAGQEAYFKLTPVADAHTFLYAMPDGTVDGDGKRFWNATDACCDLFGTHVDDVAYVNAIIDDVEERFNVDEKRIYIVGHSNGGFMAHRLACDLAPRIAAIVSLAGATWKDQTHCQPAAPVAVLEVHGTADTVVLYDGGHAGGDLLLAAHPGAEETVADWAKLDGCSPTLTGTGTTLDLDTLLPGDETQVLRHDGCQPGGWAELWRINGGGHIPNLTAQWGELVWGFLSAHPKP